LDDKRQEQPSQPLAASYVNCATCKERVAKFEGGRKVANYKCACRREWEKMLADKGIDASTMTRNGERLTLTEILAITSVKGDRPTGNDKVGGVRVGLLPPGERKTTAK